MQRRQVLWSGAAPERRRPARSAPGRACRIERARRAQALRPQQLAVFFRNNHFSVLLAHGGALMTLVTDQGYLHEPVRAGPRQ
jgi:hypothetical protein